MQFGHQAVKELIDFQMEISTAVGKPKFTTTLFAPDPKVEAAVRDYATEDLAKAILTPEKLAREDLIEEVKQKTLEHFSEQYPEQEKDIKAVLDTIVKEKVRQLILEDNIRPDGRKPTEIRPLNVEVGILPRVHGTGLFTRGQTQVLTALTLGAVSDEQILDGLGIEESKRFLHHYNFPPYSVGEARSMRGPGETGNWTRRFGRTGFGTCHTP
jgi:polyribonucleotide nucleotidyltransferase